MRSLRAFPLWRWFFVLSLIAWALAPGAGCGGGSSTTPEVTNPATMSPEEKARFDQYANPVKTGTMAPQVKAQFNQYANPLGSGKKR